MEIKLYKKTEDLTDRVFDKLTVVEFAGYEKEKATWKCLCECGNTKIILANSLKSEKTKSCGCLKHKKGKYNLKFQDLTKEILPNGIKAIKFLYMEMNFSVWLFKCHCGNEFEARSNSVKTNLTKSCGCLNHRIGKDSPNYNPNLTDEEREQQRKTQEYIIWHSRVLKRDRYTCKCCGISKSGKMIVHHKENWADNPKLRYELYNGITFCKECHIKFHKKYGYCHTNNKQTQEFIKK